ncbi:MAG: M48 family metallopeptidase [Nocardioides sp.]|jgi:Zn-dependent protease with chaperone function
MATSKPARRRTVLPAISSRAWEHPADKGALVALRRLKGFDAMLKTMSSLVSERQMRLILLGSAVRVSERQFPEVHRLLTDVGTVLDAAELPEVYVVADPTLNARTIGLNRPIIVLNSALVDLLDTDELRFVIGHELGHALSGHAVYRTLLDRMLSLAAVFSLLPGGLLGVRVIMAGLMEWSRKSELSADRAGLLACQDPAAATRVHMKFASGGDLEQLDTTEFLAQAAEYADTEDLRDSVLKALLTETRTHPFAVMRARELRTWVDGGAYTDILGGTYPRRNDDDSASVSEAAQEAAASYSEALGRAQDALGRLLHEAAGVVGSARIWLDDKLRRD